jgi:GH35 family endo-1,4-beta-xylanase
MMRRVKEDRMSCGSVLRQVWLRRAVVALAGLTVTAVAGRASAEVPEAYRKAWSEVSQQIDENIERHRKADATIELVGDDGRPIQGASLEIQQKTHAFLFGCNLFAFGQLATPELNRKYEEAFARLFNFATVPFYWRDLEPEEGKPRFAEGSAPIWRRPPPDQLVKWCQAHGITAKGHALMYSKKMFMPEWLDHGDANALKTRGLQHMAEIAERYGSRIAIWDVVNEEIPRHRHPDEWCAVPDDYLAWCFQEAARLYPREAKLLINDGTDEAHGTTGLYEGMVKGLLERGVRVDGIGMQFHVYNRGGMLAGKYLPPGHLTAVYERLGRLGLPLYITEITVPGRGDDGAALQEAIVANLYRLWFSTPHMAGLTWWNLADGTAFQEENAALGGLLDKEMNPKPAYQALDRLVNHEWRTQATAATDAAGKAQFRGFCGKYTIKVVAGDRVREFELELAKDGPAQHKFSLQP